MRQVGIAVTLIAMLCVQARAEPQNGLVAHWTFDQGKGNVLHDRSGNNSHGKIHGAKWVKCGKGYALKFDGKDDYVDCGLGRQGRQSGRGAALNIERGGTIMAWFKPEALHGGIFSRSLGGLWQDERFVLAFNTYKAANKFFLCVADGKKYRNLALAMPRLDAWSHVAVSLLGRDLWIYRDGVQVEYCRLRFAPKFGDVPLLLGECRGVGKRFFKGLMDDVLVYGRVLSGADILSLYKAQAETHGRNRMAFLTPKITITPNPRAGRLLIDVDYRLMKPMPPGATFEVAAFRPGQRRPVTQAHIPAPDDWSFTEASLDVQNEPAGRLRLTAQPRNEHGAVFGMAAGELVEWRPEQEPRFASAKGVKVLNNLCFELLNVRGPRIREFTFNNPREGWVIIVIPSFRRTLSSHVTVLLDSMEVSLKPVEGKYEAMRYISAGPHRIRVTQPKGVLELTVRAIPELFYSMYGSNPLVPETGNYTWQWLRKHVLDHYNCIIGQTWPYGSRFKYEKELREWVSHGKRWYSQRSVPWLKTVEENYDYWTRQKGMTHPLMHGIWVDEFHAGERFRKMYPIWCEAIRRIKANPKFNGRQFYTFMGCSYRPGFDRLIKTIMECGYRFAPEWYAKERPTELLTRSFTAHAYMSAAYHRGIRKQYDEKWPGAAMNRVFVLGLMSQPEETCDVRPDVNFNVFLDKQFHLIATDPAFFGTRGVQGYYSPYVGEEQTRLLSRLVRHYAIEGRSERFLKHAYVLKHLRNPDFLEGTTGWTLSAAAEGTIAAKTARGFGFLQGRYPRTEPGESVLWTRRSVDKPNVFSQEVRHLGPGRLYSLRFFTGNYQDLLNGKSRSYKHTISVRTERAEMIPEKAFQALTKSCYAYTFGAFNRGNRYHPNYHQRVFRAKGNTARLVLSDWSSADNPGGPAGEELIWNFIQVQPYFEEQ